MQTTKLYSISPHPNLVHTVLNFTTIPPIPLLHQPNNTWVIKKHVLMQALSNQFPVGRHLNGYHKMLDYQRQVEFDPRQSHDQVYHQICGGWTRTPPLNVTIQGSTIACVSASVRMTLSRTIWSTTGQSYPKVL